MKEYKLANYYFQTLNEFSLSLSCKMTNVRKLIHLCGLALSEKYTLYIPPQIKSPLISHLNQILFFTLFSQKKENARILEINVAWSPTCMKKLKRKRESEAGTSLATLLKWKII